jgi:hypothetical protein
MEFDESRPYQAGDDLRSLDWRVMARTGQPHTKLFREERERPVLVCVDLRSHMFFATRGAYKSVAAVEAAGCWRRYSRTERETGAGNAFARLPRFPFPVSFSLANSRATPYTRPQ